MGLRGVVASVLIASSVYAADHQTLDPETIVILEALFSTKSLPDDQIASTTYRLIDLEAILEESPELSEAYLKLSDEQRKQLIDLIDTLNEILSKALNSDLPSTP
jgi:hypothetical protein